MSGRVLSHKTRKWGGVVILDNGEGKGKGGEEKREEGERKERKEGGKEKKEREKEEKERGRRHFEWFLREK